MDENLTSPLDLFVVGGGVSIACYFGALGEGLQPYSAAVAVVLAATLPPVIAVATGGDAELEGRVESLRRTPAGVRATIAIDGFDQTLEIESPVETAATLGDKVPLSLTKARIFPAEANSFNHIADGI